MGRGAGAGHHRAPEPDSAPVGRPIGRAIGHRRVIAPDGSQGIKNPEIATRLGVSAFIVKRHVANILTKLDLPTRAAAAAHAARKGWV